MLIWESVMLEVSELSCGYGDIVAARDINLSVSSGEVLSIIGANGAGKSSTLMCLSGLVEQYSGSIRVDGAELAKLKPEQRIQKGISIVPEGRRIFPDLSVFENLIVGGQIVDKQTLYSGCEQAFTYFPRLRDRQRQLAGSLSGGEQQMLAIGRALMSQPKVLLVDEMSLGLMPKVVDECYEVLNDLKQKGVAIVLVEQNTERALNAADRVLLIEASNVTWQGSAEALKQIPELLDSLLGVKKAAKDLSIII
jgi:branched-chain amino acid transport system ATP-binding protein